MSKMGISTLRSYRGAQVFEAVGLDRAVVDEYFTGTASRVGGHRAGRDRRRSERAPRGRAILTRRSRGAAAERAASIGTARTASGISGPRKRSARFSRPRGRTTAAAIKEYARLINDQTRKQMHAARPVPVPEGANPCPLEEVEPASEIVKRFVTGAMSFGSISREAHETMAIAMNRLGAHEQQRRGRRGPGALQAAAERRQPLQRHQAGGQRPLRRHRRVPA